MSTKAGEVQSLISASVERVEHGTALVDQAGETMAEVVGSIRRVTDIMGEISAASNEQATGVTQVSEAVTKMDQATQQNAALVEQTAAAASTLESQARELVDVVSVFKLANDMAQRTVNPRSAHSSVPQAAARRPLALPAKANAKTLAKPAAKPQPKTQPKPAVQSKSADSEWESF